jgi:nuclear pore complex protein Nup98-Nup96
MLHIHDQASREKTIHEILCRHIRIDHEINQEYSEKEKFIIEDLNIPMKWIFLAKAIRAGALNFYQLEIKYLLKAQLLSKAHDVMMKYVAPDLFINDQIESLDSILCQFTSTNEIQSWKTQGEIFANYVKLERKVI